MEFHDPVAWIVYVNDLENISQWCPLVLKLVFQTKKVSKSGNDREIGVFFKIDEDDETQVEWLEWQRSTSEQTFAIRCRHSDGCLKRRISSTPSASPCMWT